MNNITIVYTPWSNLKKTQGMDVGQVGFHNNKLVRKFKIDKRKNDIVNRLTKTKTEANPDLAAMKAQREKADRDKAKAEKKDLKKKEEEEVIRTREEAELKSYSSLMQEDKMKSNKEMTMTAQEYEEDFF